MPEELNPTRDTGNMRSQSVADADREFAERVQAAEDARRNERLKLSPEASARVRKQRESGEAEGTGPRMLPGMAMISLFVLFYALTNVFFAWRGMFGYGITRYGTLSICTLLVIGVFGLLRLRRWGWALVLGGTLFTAFSYVLRFITAHVPLHQGIGMLMPAVFFTIFFLYLVRDEVRNSVR